MIDQLSTLIGKMVITGDFNVHWDDTGNKDRIELAELLECHNLVQHIVDQTHIKGHTIDLLITRANDNMITSTCTDQLFSDHFAIHSQFLVAKPPPPQKTITYRKLKGLDLDKMSEELQASILCCKPSSNLDNVVDQYNEVLRELLDQHAPLKSRTFVERNLVHGIHPILYVQRNLE